MSRTARHDPEAEDEYNEEAERIRLRDRRQARKGARRMKREEPGDDCGGTE